MIHTHEYKMIGGGCLVVGEDKYPCDMQFQCSCGDKIDLLTTKNGYRNIPETLTSQPRSEIHQKAIQDITDTDLGLNVIKPHD